MLKTAILFNDHSAFFRLKRAQAGMERDWSGLVENTVPFRKFKPEFLVKWKAPLIIARILGLSLIYQPNLVIVDIYRLL